MALTGADAVKSSLYKRQNNSDATRDALAPTEFGGKDRVIRFNHTLAAGDGAASVFGDNDEMNICVIPAGAVIDLKQSYFFASAALGNGTIFKVGVRAFTKVDGSTQAEDAAYIASVANAGVLSALATAGLSLYPGNGADSLAEVALNSRGPVTLFCKAVANGGTFDGDVGDVWNFQFAYRTD